MTFMKISIGRLRIFESECCRRVWVLGGTELFFQNLQVLGSFLQLEGCRVGRWSGQSQWAAPFRADLKGVLQ